MNDENPVLRRILDARNKAFEEYDLMWFRGMCQRLSESALVAAFHKARYDCTAIEDEYRHESGAWLRQHGYRAMGGLPVLPPGELPKGNEFVEIGSGATMKMGWWYIVSDSGSIYCNGKGFNSVDRAKKYWAENCKEEYGDEDDLAVPNYDKTVHSWDNEWSMANVLKADDLYDFWINDDPAAMGVQSDGTDEEDN